MSNKPPAKAKPVRRALIIGFLGSAFCGVLLGALTGRWDAALIIFALCFGVIFGLVGIGILTIAIHELGHLVGGLLAGYEFKSVQVGETGFERTLGRYKFTAVKDPIAEGFVSMIPPDVEPNLARFRIFILGGPLANLISAVVVAIILVMLQPFRDVPLGERLIPVFGIPFGLCSFAMFVLNLRPVVSPKGMPLDGLWLRRIRTEPAATKRSLALTILTARIREGVLARNWAAPVMEALDKPSDGSLDEVRARYLRFYWHCDRNQVHAGWEELERATSVCKILGGKAGIFSELVASQQVFAAAWLFRDASLTRSLGTLEPPGNDDLISGYAMGQAAVALLEGRNQEALTWIEKSRVALTEACRRLQTKSPNDFAWLDEMECAARQ